MLSWAPTRYLSCVTIQACYPGHPPQVPELSDNPIMLSCPPPPPQVPELSDNPSMLSCPPPPPGTWAVWQSKHALLGTHTHTHTQVPELSDSELVGFLLDVSQKKKHVGTVYLPIEPLKLILHFELVSRCKSSTHQPIDWSLTTVLLKPVSGFAVPLCVIKYCNTQQVIPTPGISWGIH